MINDINFNSKHYDTFKFAIKFIHLVIISIKICTIFVNYVYCGKTRMKHKYGCRSIAYFLKCTLDSQRAFAYLQLYPWGAEQFDLFTNNEKVEMRRIEYFPSVSAKLCETYYLFSDTTGKLSEKWMKWYSLFSLQLHWSCLNLFELCSITWSNFRCWNNICSSLDSLTGDKKWDVSLFSFNNIVNQ